MMWIRISIFAVLLLAAFLSFAWTLSRFYRFMAKGKPDLKFDKLGQRLTSVLVYWLAQKKVGEPVSYHTPKGVTSKHHLIIFWGFLIITLGTIELFVNGLIPGFSLAFLGPIYIGLRWIIDVFNLLVLLAIGYAFFRRLVLKPKLIPLSVDASLILGQIALLMLTHFGFHAGKQVLGEESISSGPISAGFAVLLRVGSPHFVLIFSEICYWMHIVVLLVFLNYIPYSKHIHIIGSLPNIFFRNLGQKGVMPKLNLDDENDYGVGKIEQFSQKSLMDEFACTECARCSNFCPAYNTEKPLSPMHLIHDLKDEMLEKGRLGIRLQEQTKKLKKAQEISKKEESHSLPTQGSSTGAQQSLENNSAETTPVPKNKNTIEELTKEIALLNEQIAALPPLVGGRIKDETLWACTTCGACQEVCPVFIEHPLKIQQMKTFLVLSEGRVPVELQRTFQNLERHDNPWGLPKERKMEWAEGLAVKTLAENPDPEYLLFIGCAGAFDERIKKTMRALVEVLCEAQVSFAVLGKEEGCSGDPARRAGNEFLFQQQAEANVTAMNEAKIRKVIASCPHCFHTIKNEYPQFGGQYEVIHHSQLLAHLLKEGKLQTETSMKGKVTYHDSCYLGRWNGEYEAPRDIVKNLSEPGQFVELDRNKQHGFCCGAGGGRMWQEEKGPRVNRNRTEEILSSGADIAAVACPFCTIMISDGMKDANAEEKVQVLDVAEVVRKSLINIRKKEEKNLPVR